MRVFLEHLQPGQQELSNRVVQIPALGIVEPSFLTLGFVERTPVVVFGKIV
jgi:hypothetical protein